MNKKALILFIVISILSTYSIFKTFSDIYQKSRRINDLKSEITDLEKENESQGKDLAYKNSREFVEKEAREKLFMGLPGEKILIVPQNFFENMDKEIETDKAEDETHKPVWKQWLEIFTQ